MIREIREAKCPKWTQSKGKSNSVTYHYLLVSLDKSYVLSLCRFCLFLMYGWITCLSFRSTKKKKNKEKLKLGFKFIHALSGCNKIKEINLQFSSVYVFLILKICVAFLKFPKTFQWPYITLETGNAKLSSKVP